MARSVEEKRKYLRLNSALEIEYIIPQTNKVYNATTKDISASGLKFEAPEKLSDGIILEIKLKIPRAQNAIHANGRVAWSNKTDGENDSGFDVGIEFMKIDEDNKNTFLKYLCDLIYG